MNVTHCKGQAPKEEISLPAMYKFLEQNTELVILFNSASTGMVLIAKGNTSRNTGEYATSLISCWDTSHWRRLAQSESVTLTN